MVMCVQVLQAFVAEEGASIARLCAPIRHSKHRHRHHKEEEEEPVDPMDPAFASL